jgi:chromosome segregation ATPase
LDDVQKQLDAAVKRHAALQKEHAPCADVITDLEAQTGDSKKQLSLAQKKLAAIEQDHASLAKEHSISADTIAELEREAGDLKRQLGVLVKKHSALEKTHTAQEQAMTELESRQASLEEMNSDDGKLISKLKKQQADLEKRLVSKDGDIETLQQESARRHNCVGELENTLQSVRLEAHSKILELEQLLREETDRRHKLEEDVPNLERQIDDLRPYKHSSAVLQASVNARDEQIEQLSRELGESLRDAKEARQRVHDLQRESSAMIRNLEDQVQHGLQVAEASNKDTEEAYARAQRVEGEKTLLEQALAASNADNAALRQRLREDAQAHEEDDKSAANAMEEILKERKRERKEGEQARVQALQKAKEEHDKELEAILEQHANEQQRADEEIKRLRRTQNELETALSHSRAERENEEMQAHEAMNIVAAEMTAVRNECSSLEDQLAEMRKVISQNNCAEPCPCTYTDHLIRGRTR